VHAGPAEEASQVMVVFNLNMPESGNLARFYADKRKIPSQNVVGLNCSDLEEITREEYERTIRRPLQQALISKGGWKTASQGGKTRTVSSKIKYVVLMYGVPLKMRAAELPPWQGEAPQPPQIWNETRASVDSELAALGMAEAGLIWGALPNPAYREGAASAAKAHPDLLLVTRLDGPTPELVKAMITRGLEAEARGLEGYVFVDARGIETPGLKVGDEWLVHAGDLLLARGMPVVIDRREALFPGSYPFRNVAIYLGWYSGRAVAPFRRDAFQFEPGAVAVHIHSFSAESVRTKSDKWVGPLIARGVSATAGNVYEPFLQLTLQLDLFMLRLLDGSNFAESAYAALPVLSWMSTCIGDPLYRPFKMQTATSIQPSNMWTRARNASRAWQQGRNFEAAGVLGQASAGDERGVIAESIALAAMARRNIDDALKWLGEARAEYPSEPDKLRTFLLEIEALILRGDKAEALVLLRKTMRAMADPTTDSALLLREVEFSLDPPVAPAPVNPGTAPAP